MSLHSLTYRTIQLTFGSSNYNRITSSIDRLWIEFDAALQSREPSEIESAWATATIRNLMMARKFADDAFIEKGWTALADARLWMLRGMKEKRELDEIAVVTFREVNSKLSGWRAKSALDLLCDETGKLRADIADHPENLVGAVRLLSDQAETTQHRIALRGDHLAILSWVLFFALAATIILSWKGLLPDRLSDLRLLLTVIVGGTIGAGISVVQSLTREKLDQRIPEQTLGALAAFTRPILGAATAVAAFALIEANSVLALSGGAIQTKLLFAVAMAAGYSERFIIGAFDHLSATVGNTKN